jgi:glycerol-3-phosphate dehydrogenase (NAD(P)+)
MKIAVLGFGSWGTALASLLHHNGHDVTMWDVRELDPVNPRTCPFIAGYSLPDDVAVTQDVRTAADGAECFVLTVPSYAVRDVLERFQPYFDKDKLIINSGKGIDEVSLKRLSQVIEEITPCRVGVISGPCHAEELIRRIPSAYVAASADHGTAQEIQNIFMSQYFRVYCNDDVTGVEIGGALKNVIALAAGCSDGLGYGDNTKAALMTRGIAEISRLGAAMGAKAETFAGLAGIGDLIVTCTSMHSRNRRAGMLLGQGKTVDDTLAEVKATVQGVDTAKAAYRLSLKYNVTMPITTEVYKVLFEGKPARDAVNDLMGRDKTNEER